MEHRTSSLVFCLALALLPVIAPQLLAAQSVNVTTGHQDIPASICSGTGCVYRTGQNLQEGTLTYSSITQSSFGQYCNYALDGQVFGQPLVVTNVKWTDGQTYNIVYVVTMNGTVYAFNGSPSAPTHWPSTSPCPLLGSQSLLGTGNSAASCANLGGLGCATIAPNVGILSTPVISATIGTTTTGSLYVVSELQSAAPVTYSHTLSVLDITSLSVTTSLTITPPSGCYSDTTFSQKHIQRPALLLGGDNYLYIAFSMMDGNPQPYPNGIMLAYNTASLSNKPLCLALSQGATLADGAGIWGGGGGPVFAQDGIGGSFHIFFNTGNGGFDGQTNWGDTFVKMSSASTGGLSVDSHSYTPGDQYGDPIRIACMRDVVRTVMSISALAAPC